MKNFLPFIFFMVSSSFLTQAQDLSWSINIAPAISYRSFPYQSNQGQLPLSAVGEQPMHTFDFGADMRVLLHKRLSIGAGVFYSQKGFSNNYLSAVYQHANVDANYLVDYQQHHLDIPIFITYNLYNKNKVMLYPMAGIVNSMLLSENNRVVSKIELSNPDIMQLYAKPYLQATTLHQFGLLAGFGVSTSVNDKTQVGLEARSKFMLTPLLDTQSLTNRYLYTVGLNFRFIRTLR